MLFSIIMIFCGALFTGMGVYAWRKKKPMHFWSGATVKESEIRDIPAYNRANGMMWILFSLIFWVSALAGVWSAAGAAILEAVGFVIGIPALVIAYRRIYQKYKA